MRTYAAEWAWYSLAGTVADGAAQLEHFTDVKAIREAWGAQEANVRAFLETLGEGGITKVFEYKLLSGQPGASAFWQMLQHVVNHGSYHRGQVTTMLRQLGAKPPKSMDLIAYYREADARRA